MRLQNPFAVVSTTGMDSQVLTVLARAEQYLTVHQIHQLLPEVGSPQGVRNSVTRLVAHGTLLERATGRSYGYALNREHILVDAILQIADVKRTLLSNITEVIAGWHVQPLTAKMFGSAARGEMDTDSDIDLFFVMPDSPEADEGDDLISRLAAQVTRWTGNDVRPLVYRVSEVKPASIFDSIAEEGIDVAGDPSWLRRHLRKADVT